LHGKIKGLAPLFLRINMSSKVIKLNEQPIEKYIDSDGKHLNIASIFYTIQGEGPFCGTPAIFIRLAGCNLQCPKCDTDYTRYRKEMPLNDILSEITKCFGFKKQISLKNKLIVITGGEPFRQNIFALINELLKAGAFVQIETNGTLSPGNPIIYNKNITSRTGLYLVVSPKSGKVHPNIWLSACGAKYTVGGGGNNQCKNDGLPIYVLDHHASPHVARPNSDFDGLIYVQPADEKNKATNAANLTNAIDSSLRFGHILQIQIHKIIGVE
jgi:organic radical activating enzyme